MGESRESNVAKSEFGIEQSSERFYAPINVRILEVEKKFNGKKKECFSVEISGVDYQSCVNASENYWSNSKKGKYGAGLGRTDDDPFKPVRTGLLGEMAFAKVFGTKVDLSYRKHGDSEDGILFGHRFDIKCAMRNYGCGLIYHTSESGVRIPLDKDVYVFGYIESESRVSESAFVILTGYMLQKDVLKCKVKPGRKRGSKHLNYEVPFGGLRSMKRLYDATVRMRKYFDF